MNKIRLGAAGAAVGVVGVAVVTAAMVPLRTHLAVATSALVLVVPVVVAVTVGGFRAGVVAVGVGFLSYDFFFIPPYGTLTVGARQNWVALGVYVIVMLVVARVVDRLQSVRLEAALHAAATRRLFELSDMLIAEKPLPELLGAIVETVQAGFSFTAVALFLPGGDELSGTGTGIADDAPLELVAAAGEPLSEDELRVARPSGGVLSSLVSRVGGGRGIRSQRLLTVPLVATGHPVGVLVAKGAPMRPNERDLLHTYANQAALAVERAKLRQQALRSDLLEEVDRWRSALMGAVSHDLRTPLATVKAAVSDLRRSDVALSDADSDELLGLIESQSDRLARLVTNVLDMARIQTGALVPRLEETSFGELLDEALHSLRGTDVPERVVRSIEEGLPLVAVDHALISQVLANLLDNAGRHAPDAGPIEVRARAVDGHVEVSVTDRGSGIAPADRERIFLLFNRPSGAGRGGLGLAIVKAFLDAHGQTIVVSDAPGGGATFTFGLPVALYRASVLIDADEVLS